MRVKVGSILALRTFAKIVVISEKIVRSYLDDFTHKPILLSDREPVCSDLTRTTPNLLKYHFNGHLKNAMRDLIHILCLPVA